MGQIVKNEMSLKKESKNSIEDNKGENSMNIESKYGHVEALVAEVVRSRVTLSPGGSPGRTAVQKLCYFAQVLGVPLHLDFQIHHYGPFSNVFGGYWIISLLMVSWLTSQSTETLNKT